MLGGNATVLLLFLLNAVFRGAGDAAIAMRVLLLGNMLNIVLGPCFIFGLGPFPAAGRDGRGGRDQHRPRHGRRLSARRCWRGARARARRRAPPARSICRSMRTVLRLSGSGTMQILIGTASYIGLVRILSLFGSAALAGYTIGIRVDPVRAAAGIRYQQRRGDDGRAEPGRRQPRSRRARGVDRGAATT